MDYEVGFFASRHFIVRLLSSFHVFFTSRWNLSAAMSLYTRGWNEDCAEGASSSSAFFILVVTFITSVKTNEGVFLSWSSFNSNTYHYDPRQFFTDTRSGV